MLVFKNNLFTCITKNSLETTVTKHKSITPPLFGAKWETTNSANINSFLYCGQTV